MTANKSAPLKYEPIAIWSRESVEAALLADDPNRLYLAVLGASMYGEDQEYAQQLCVRLARHRDVRVRGNAILGFGYIARVHGKLDQALVQPIIELALGDEHKYVAGHAVDAVMDTENYLGWSYEDS